MKKKVVINAMGKRITIDNPTDIDIKLRDKDCQPFSFNLKINREYMERLKIAFGRFGR